MSTPFEASNIAFLGSSDDHKAKLASAQKEDAWSKIVPGPGLNIWRIEQFKVKPWPKEKFGTFFSGDCYLVLETYKGTNDKLNYNLYFWIGKSATQDEYGTVAYKAVELDEFLNGTPVQYREVEGFESDKFRKVFPHLLYLDGGADSGFSAVKPEAYKPRLLQVKGKKNPRVFSVPLELNSLNAGDVFILDLGLTIYQWNGAQSNVDEKTAANKVVRAIDEERFGKPKTVVLDGLEDDDLFWSHFGGKPGSVNPPVPDVVEVKASPAKLYRLSDNNIDNTLKLELVSDGQPKKSDLKNDDVYILDIGIQVYAYVGHQCSDNEKKNALRYATKYIVDQKLPATTPVVKVVEHSECSEFLSYFV